MTTDTIRVLCADDTDIAVEGMRRILESEPDIRVVGQVTRRDAVVGAVREQYPDVVLLDMKWGGVFEAGCDLIRQIKQAFPEIGIVVITVYDHLVAAAKQAGADEVVTKDISGQDLKARIRAVNTQDLPPVPQTMLPEEPLVDSLSEREMEVLALLAKGMTDREIAERLFIAPSTAKNHVRNILSKLNAQNRTHAVKLARERGLLK